MRRLLLAAILATFAHPALAQSGGKLEGRVTEAGTNTTLPGVNIFVLDTERGTVTNAQGEYFILNLPAGSYSVRASMVGFTTVTQTEVVINQGRTTELNFQLAESVLELDEEIVVTATRPDIVPDRTSSSEFFRMADIADNPGIRDISDVLALSADVMDGHFRGGRSGEELYNLAGMGIVNPLSNARAFAPIMSAVEEVEVITSGFSAQYGNAQSGVVNISMREGNPQAWDAKVEYRTRLPGYKHFGTSVFDVASNPYLQLLDSWEKWMAEDDEGRAFFDYGGGFATRYVGGLEPTREDSIRAAQVAHAMWQQARRDLNWQYNDLWDNAVDVAAGGPLSSRARMFFATRYEREWTTIPTNSPDLTRQVMGNIAYDFGGGKSLRISGAYDVLNGHNFRGLGSQNYQSFRDWLWDRSVGVNDLLNESFQIGARFSHALSERTYYEIKLNRLQTYFQEGTHVLAPDRYREDNVTFANWNFLRFQDEFRSGHFDNRFLNERTATTSLDGSITSQVTSSHMILAGVQANYYQIDVENRLSLASPAQASNEFYRAQPFEVGLYIQDKMEFEGMIANIGLRLDAYNQNVDYYSDLFSPFRNPNYDPLQPPIGDNRPYDPDLAAREPAPTVVSIQPRIGVSFPISEATVFHLNYGSFLQRPAFNRSIFTRVSRQFDNPLRIGNPRLEPERTESYEVGVAQALGEGFTLDLSGYYKDVKNLLELALFQDAQQQIYETFMNRDYADIRGFRIAVNKRRGAIRGAVRYNYSVATGKASTPFDAPPTHFEQPAEGQPSVDRADPGDILLDFDRTHNIVGNLTTRTAASWGPRVAGFYPLERIYISVRSTARSGRPYGSQNRLRGPMEYNTDLKITKDLPEFMGTRASLYAEVFNVFNQRVFSYNSVFRNDRNRVRYAEAIERGVDPHEELRFFDEDAPFTVDQQFLIYGNSPRSVFLGLTLDL